MKKIAILIPTYNRCEDLDYNLSCLVQQIVSDNLINRVDILVSNNASTDNTVNVLKKHALSSKGIVKYLDDHQSNVGLESNALYVLEKATSDFVMYLGDDDYLEDDYLKRVVSLLDTHPNLGCIIPNFYGITPRPEKRILYERDKNAPIYRQAGYEACLAVAHEGHQLSGLVFHREGLLEEYKKRGVHNIYPFIFMVAYTCLHFDVYHMSDSHTLVTQVPQNKKDWGYGEDGLMNEIFDNYKRLGLGIRERANLECRFLEKNTWRFLMYRKRSKIVKTTLKILFAPNLSFVGRVLIFRLIYRQYYYPELIKELRIIIGKWHVSIRNRSVEN